MRARHQELQIELIQKQTLIGETYNSFLLTIECNTVAIHHTLDGTFKVFDSHARDSFGMAHPQGTCVLLHVQEINKLVEYFQSIIIYY